MSNNKYKISYNESKMLDTLARNLNLSLIAEGSNLHKLAMAYKEESNTFSDFVNDTIDNAYIATMSDSNLISFGNSIGLSRKVYSNVKLFKEDSAVLVKIDTNDILVSNISSPLTVFKYGDSVYMDDNLTIKANKDVIISAVSDEIYISVTVTSPSTPFYVASGSIYKTRPTYQGKDILPVITIQIDRDIGLTTLEESIDSYRFRILNSLYMANNGANSTLNTILNEIPYIYTIETEDYSNRSIKTIYPYTKELINTGSDTLLSRVLVPSIKAAISNNSLYGSNILVKEPTPLYFSIGLKLPSGSTNLYKSYTSFIDTFNNTLYKEKTISKDDILNFLYSNTNLKEEDVKSISIVFTSPYVVNETYELPSDTINIPKGRFLHLTSVSGEV